MSIRSKNLLPIFLLAFSSGIFSQSEQLSQDQELSQAEELQNYNFGEEASQPFFERYRFYLLGSYGYAPGDTSIDEINQRASDRGLRTNLNSVDDSRAGGELGLGYWLTERFSLELAYTNLGEVEVRGDGILNSEINEFIDIIEEVHPDSGDGYSLSGIYNHPFSDKLSAFLRVGLFKWRGDYETRVGGVTQRGSDRKSNEDYFLGLGIKYQLSDRFDAFAEWRDYDFDADDTHFWQLGLHFYFGKTHQPKVVELAMMPAAGPSPNTDTDNDGVPNEIDECPDTPSDFKVNEVGCVIQQSVELLIEFPTDSAEVSQTYFYQIERVAKVMQNHPDIDVEIEGHTDNTGTNRYNLNLSKRRAESVKAILIKEFNIPAERVYSYGYGEDRPVASNQTSEGKQRNRRVMAKIVKK